MHLLHKEMLAFNGFLAHHYRTNPRKSISPHTLLKKFVLDINVQREHGPFTCLHKWRFRIPYTELLFLFSKTCHAMFGALKTWLIDIKKSQPRFFTTRNARHVFTKALECGNALVLELIADKIHPSYNNNEALRYASKHGHYTILEMLVRFKNASAYYSSGTLPELDFTVDDHKALRNAVKNGHDACAELLLRDVYTGSIEQQVLHELLLTTIVHNRYSMFIMLLSSQKLDIDPTYDDNEAVLYAIEYKQLSMAFLLLRNERVFKTLDLQEALYVACIYDNHVIANAFLQYETIDPCIRDNELIVDTAKEGADKCLVLLLADGRANPSAQHNEAIRLAAKNGHFRTVKLLVKHDRKASTRHSHKLVIDANDNAAQLCARKNHHHEIYEYLERAKRRLSCDK